MTSPSISTVHDQIGVAPPRSPERVVPDVPAGVMPGARAGGPACRRLIPDPCGVVLDGESSPAAAVPAVQRRSGGCGSYVC